MDFGAGKDRSTQPRRERHIVRSAITDVCERSEAPSGGVDGRSPPLGGAAKPREESTFRTAKRPPPMSRGRSGTWAILGLNQ